MLARNIRSVNAFDDKYRGMTRVVSLFSVTLVALAVVRAADIHGNIVIERKLTKRNVTPASGLYQRGVAVRLGEDELSDPLAYERSHVVIYLEGAWLKGAALQATWGAAIEQRDRRFVPDLVVIPAGGSVTFPNVDPVFHNVFSLSKPKEFDLGNYPKGQSRSVTFGKEGVVYVLLPPAPKYDCIHRCRTEPMEHNRGWRGAVYDRERSARKLHDRCVA